MKCLFYSNVIFLFALMYGCGKINSMPHDVSDDLTRKFGEISSADSTVDVRDYKEIDWDRIYVFTPYSSEDTINNSLPNSLNKKIAEKIGVSDIVNLLVFCYKDKVSGYAYIPREVVDFTKCKNGNSIAKSSAIFKVIREEYKYGIRKYLIFANSSK